MAIDNQVLFLGTGGSVTAAAADLTLANHILQYAGGPAMDFRTIQATTGVVQPVTEVAQQSVFTPGSAVAGTRYGFTIRQKLASGVLYKTTFAYTAATGDTATLICDALKAAVRLSNLEVTVDADGAATITMDADAGSPIFTTDGIVPSVATFPDGASAATPGVAAVNDGDDLIAEGITGAVSGQTYWSAEYDYIESNKALGDNGGVRKFTVYVNTAAANRSDLTDYMTETMQAFPRLGTTSDPEAIALANP